MKGCTATFTGGDGKQATLSISVSPQAKTGPFTFDYSYATDGNVEEQRFIMPADPHVGTTTIDYTFMPAGRVNRKRHQG